ncbi:hypothetical protein AVEN_266365-1 [Araneus ventricosus]|uniref:Uncharacterized protein n=1 Tax=Araneus ventricosus TaxID=182803 RepID=A0A4Y2CPX2_ARAVE|nr:hypothetical protein AVEN_266365-1 [Araneus ventricosus]
MIEGTVFLEQRHTKFYSSENSRPCSGAGFLAFLRYPDCPELECLCQRFSLPQREIGLSKLLSSHRTETAAIRNTEVTSGRLENRNPHEEEKPRWSYQ